MENAQRKIDLLVIHCAATPNGQWTSTLDVDHWRTTRRSSAAADGPGARAQSDLKAIGYRDLHQRRGGPPPR